MSVCDYLRLFVVRCLLFHVFVVCYLLIGVRCSIFVVCCSLFDARCVLLCVLRCALSVVSCASCVAR